MTFHLQGFSSTFAPLSGTPQLAFYLDSVAGDDGNPGTEAEPWQTLTPLSTALSDGHIRNGMTVYFAGGDSWTGSLDRPDGVAFAQNGAGAEPTVNGVSVLDLGFTDDFEASTGQWEGIDGTIAVFAANRPGSAGTHCLRLTATGALNYPCAWHFDTPTTPGGWYCFDAWIVKRNSGSSVGTDVRTNDIASDQMCAFGGAWTVDTWKRVINTLHVPSSESTVAGHFAGPVAAVTQYMDMDDMSWTELTFADLLADITTESDTVTASGKITHTIDTGALGIYGQTGVVVNLDDDTNPQNCVIVYLEWDAYQVARVVLEKRVAGTWTKLVDELVTFVQGAYIQCIRTGNSYQAYYNGAAVGTGQTISDASIISNTKHGTFSTVTQTAVNNFTAVDGQQSQITIRRIAASGDDGRWQEGNTTINVIGRVRTGYYDGTWLATNSFYRFDNVLIPVGATITEAHLDIIAYDDATKDTVNLLIDAIKAADPAAPTTYNEAETPAGGRTTASVVWNAVAQWSASEAIVTPDIATIIQELVNQVGWASGQAMCIYLEDNASSAVNYTTRTPTDYDANPTNAAVLRVLFTE